MNEPEVIQAAVEILSAATRDYKQLEGEEGTAEEVTNEYRELLILVLLLWITRNRNVRLEDQQAVNNAILALANQLEQVAIEELPVAFAMGSGGPIQNFGEIAELGALTVENQFFLDGSFAPYMLADLVPTENPLATIGDVAAVRESAWASRIGLYAGAFWTAIWLGLGFSVLNRLLQNTQPTRRLLDPAADHCTTCPPKAMEYGSWNEMLAFTGGLPADGSDDCHSNCFPSGTIVDGPRPSASFGRWYSGPLIEITTAFGNDLTCTPNHPILTARGWVAAQFLHEGDHLIGRRGGNRPRFRIDPNDHQVPTRIEEIGRSENIANSKISVKMGSAEDFHGDGLDGQVYVIRTNGQLPNRGKAALFEPLGELDFGIGDSLSSGPLLGFGAGVSHGQRISHAAPSLMSGPDISLIGRGGSFAHHESVGIGYSSALSSTLSQNPLDRIASYAIPSSKAILRFASEIGSDQIVSIWRTPSFHGNVFNLETEPQWYFANGIIVHNCRCQIEVLQDGEWIGTGI